MHRQAWTGICLVLLCTFLSFAACADAVDAKGGRDRLRLKLLGKQLRLLQEEAAGLTSPEVDAVIKRLQQADPEAFAGRDMSELKEALKSVDLKMFGMDPASGNMTPVTSVILEGLNATAGDPGTPASTPSEASFNVTPFSPPDDCPGWSCVCADQPAHSRVVAPDNCQAFVTCDGNGNGTKALCPIAGSGFDPDTGLCKPLDSSSVDNKCSFAGVVAAFVDDTPSDSTSYTCSDLLALKETVNLKEDVSSESDAVGCALRQPAMSARVEIKTTNESTIITTVVLKYLEKGPATPITVSSARGDANITTFRTWRQTIRSRVSQQLAADNITVVDVEPELLIWQPRRAMVAFTPLAGAAVITIPRMQEGSDLLLLSVDVTEAPLPTPEMQAALHEVTDPGEEPLMGTEVEIPETPASSCDNDGDMVSAQSFAGALRPILTKAWKQLDNVAGIDGFMSNVNGRAITAGDMNAYLITYQNALVGSSQCYRNSYGRGAGIVPSYWGDWSNEGGICYEHCAHNFYPLGERCPSGWEDHCFVCHRVMNSYWNDDRGCRWWDICALWDRQWCRVCDWNNGYRRDGCICTRPPVWQGKQTYVKKARGTTCWPDRENQHGLCYPSCGESYWGDGPICYNHCPDAFPHDCGAGLCTKNAQACGQFVADAVLDVVNMVGSIASAVGTGFAGMGQVLMAAAEVAGFFGSTKACIDSRIHLRSGLAVVTVNNREFQGNHIAAFGGTNWDGCLIRCRRTGNCRAVLFNRKTAVCTLMDSVGSGPHGHNAHAPDIDAAVLIMDAKSASWQFSLGNRIILPGSVIPIEPGVLGVQHGTAVMQQGVAPTVGLNLALCQLICIQKECDFFAYSDTVCIMMNRGSSTDPLRVAWRGAEGIHSVMVNMAKWTDYDAGGRLPAGL